MLLASGVAMVSLVVALGKAGVVNRQAIAGSLGMGLAQLASIANIGVTTGSEIHLLDQAFVMCTLNTGTLILLAMLSLNSGFDKPAEQFDSRRLWRVIVILAIVCPFAFGVHLLVGGLVLAVTITLLHFACFTRRVGLATLSLCVAGGIPFLLLIGWMGQSLLFPVSPGTIQQCVESFDTAPYSSASWKQWEVSAAWLTDSGSEFDHSKPRQLLEQELDGKQNVVFAAHWRLFAKSDKTTASTCGVQKIETDDLSRFVPYENLTEELVIDWVKGAMVKNNIKISDMETMLDAEIADIESPKIENVPVPWAQ